MQQIALVALAIESKQKQEIASRTVNQSEVGLNEFHSMQANCQS